MAVSPPRVESRRLSRRPKWFAALGAAALAACSGAGRGEMPTLPLEPLPPLGHLARNANYTIEARLDPDRHTIEGGLVLDRRNTADVALSTFPFHL